MRIKLLILILSIVLNNSLQASTNTEEAPFKVSSKPSQNIQKYTGFTFLTTFIGKSIIKYVVKKETHAKSVKVNIDSFSGVNLIQKKAKSANILAEDLLIEGIPIASVKAETKSPIYIKTFKRENGKKYYGPYSPIDASSEVIVDIANANEIINNLPKWKKMFEAIDLPIPPFGEAKVSVDNLKMNVNDSGFADVSVRIKSVTNPESEPLNVRFVGKIALEGKKIYIRNLEGEVEDVIEKNTELANSFNEVLEELINPILNFEKFEDNSFNFGNIDLQFKDGKAILNFEVKVKEVSEIK